MTTRHIVTDSRSSVSTDCGLGMVGLFHEKYQAGSNTPKGKPKIPLPYSMTDVLILDGLLEWTYPGSPGVYRSGTFVSCFGGLTVNLPSFDSNDMNGLVNKIGEKIKQHDFNAAVSVGAEGKEALEQVASKTMEAYRGFKNLRNGNVQGALRNFGLSPKHAKKVGLHKDLSGRVLATQLGWIPLLSDIQSAAQAYHALTSEPKKLTINATRRKHGSVTVLGTDCGGTCFRSRRLTWTLSEELSWQQSLGLSNPWDFADAVWNATTLSFIADWFIPIGSYLEARSLASTLKGSGYYTDFVKVSARSPQRFSVYTLKNGGTYVMERCEVNRVVLSSLESLVSLPRWKDPRSVPSLRRALTSVALATQMFS